MMKTKPVATTPIGCHGYYILISYPQRQDIFWAFIMHVSGAAMIGGLADWYAVTALFTKPLGIPFKTAILPRSRNVLSNGAHHAPVKSYCVCLKCTMPSKRTGYGSHY